MIANDAVTLGTHTLGNYVATVADAGSGDITVVGSGSETAAITLDIADDSLDFTEFEDTLDLDTTTEINAGASSLVIDLDGVGDLVIQDAGTAFATFRDSGSLLLGGELIAYNAATSSSTEEGAIYYDTDDDNLYVYANGAFVDLTQQDTDTDTTYTAGSDLDLSGTEFSLEAVLDVVSTINLAGTGTLNGLDAIDATTESTLEAALDIGGSVTGTGLKIGRASCRERV